MRSGSGMELSKTQMPRSHPKSTEAESQGKGLGTSILNSSTDSHYELSRLKITKVVNSK